MFFLCQLRENKETTVCAVFVVCTSIFHTLGVSIILLASTNHYSDSIFQSFNFFSSYIAWLWLVPSLCYFCVDLNLLHRIGPISLNLYCTDLHEKKTPRRYPSDVDKHILARQTGLSRSQVCPTIYIF